MRHVEREIGYTIVNLEIACADNIFVAEKRWLAVYDQEVRRLAAPLLTWRSGTLHLLVEDNQSANQATNPRRCGVSPRQKGKQNETNEN